MLNSLCLNLALRFRRSSRYGRLARFISLSSTLGIAVGVCALMVGLSAMNGFEYELKNRVLSLVPTVQLKATAGYFQHLKDDLELLNSAPNLQAAPALTVEGVFQKGSAFCPAAAIGIEPELETRVIDLERFMTAPVSRLEAEQSVILGAGIARKLQLEVGDTLDFLTSGGTDTSLRQPKRQELTVVGLFKTGGQIDKAFSFIHLNEAKALSGLVDANTIHVKTADLLRAQAEVYEVCASNFVDPAVIESWLTTQGKLYRDIQLIRGIMYLAMILVMGVACFNIVSNLIMSVSEKSSEIAILMTMGSPRSLIIKTFTLMGLLQGLKGSLYGLSLGCLISLMLEPITAHFKAWFGFDLLNEEVYFINFIPARLQLQDALLVLLCAVIMSTLASLYPAYRASRLNPAVQLREQAN